MRDTPQNRKTYYRQVIASARSKDPAAAEVVEERRRHELWDGRDREAWAALIRQAAKDCSLCTVCAAPIAPGQSVTLRRCDIGKHFPWWAWAPVCLTCTLSRLRERPWPYSYEDHPSYDGFRRFRCRACGRPVRISAANHAARSPTCCETCDRQHRLQRNAERRRVKHEPMTCIECGETFIPKRADAVTCSNKCRQAQHRRRAQPDV
jgi:hypothetical protein